MIWNVLLDDFDFDDDEFVYDDLPPGRLSVVCDNEAEEWLEFSDDIGVEDESFLHSDDVTADDINAASWDAMRARAEFLAEERIPAIHRDLEYAASAAEVHTLWVNIERFDEKFSQWLSRPLSKRVHKPVERALRRIEAGKIIVPRDLKLPIVMKKPFGEKVSQALAASTGDYKRLARDGYRVYA